MHAGLLNACYDFNLIFPSNILMIAIRLFYSNDLKLIMYFNRKCIDGSSDFYYDRGQNFYLMGEIRIRYIESSKFLTLASVNSMYYISWSTLRDTCNSAL